MVLAKNIETGEQNYRLVLQTFVRKSYNLVLIKINGKIIETTTEHPFWVMGKGWTEAGELEEDDILEDSDGNTVEIESIEYKEFENEITVYNFEVDKDHDYYVSRNNILVHNNDTCFKVADDIIEGAGEANLYRRIANIGEFKELSEPMQLRNVKKLANEAGIGLDGVKVKIIRDPELVGKGLCGYASPDGKSIYLYPDAFTNTESLVKTLGHERMHIYQTRTLGPALDSGTLNLYEQGAWGTESSWWQYYKRGGN